MIYSSVTFSTRSFTSESIHVSSPRRCFTSWCFCSFS